MTPRLAITLEQHNIMTQRLAITLERHNIMTQRLAITLEEEEGRGGEAPKAPP
jgi:hypothetical protein